MSGKIFISYRREDSAGHAGRIRDRLVSAFGPENVFMDVDSLSIGDNLKRLSAAVAECQVLVAVIGPNWLEICYPHGDRRLDDKNDYVRIEIATALERDITLMPILLDGAKAPARDRLPDDLKPLATILGLNVRHDAFDDGMKRLLAEVTRRFDALAPAPIEPESGSSRKGSSGAQAADEGMSADRTKSGWLARRLSRWSVAAAACAGAVLAAAILGVVAWQQLTSGPVPHWTLERTSFIGGPIQFKWSYDATAAAPNRPVWYELESASDSVLGLIRLDRQAEIYSDRKEKELRHVNGSRLWRVRAVDRPGEGRRALSGWSADLRIVQYESAFERIRATRRVLLYVSNSQNQGIFKWVVRQARGFDIDLANTIAAALSETVNDGRPPLQQPVDPIPVEFEAVLEAPRDGLADISIASITKLRERESRFNLRFSETYFCTTFSLLHRVGEQERPIRELIAGLAGIENQPIGVQKGSTGALLFTELNKQHRLSVEAFATSEDIAAALRNGKIRYGVTDTTFAVATKLSFPRELDYKEFTKGDFPASFPVERQVQNYGVAVRSGEDDLLDVINQTIIRIRNDGTLLRMLKKAAQDYEDEHRGSSANLVPSDRPWSCSVPD